MDPVGVKAGDPITFNRYAYANDNPMTYIDPDGRFSWHGFWGGITHFFGGIGHISIGVNFGAGGWGPMGNACFGDYCQSTHFNSQTAEYTGMAALGVLGAVAAPEAIPEELESESDYLAAIEGEEASSTALTKFWPDNNGFLGESSAQTLEKGTLIDRYGSEYGYFTSPANTPMEMRALPPTADLTKYSMYRVIKPVVVQAGRIAPAFGRIGLGKQYLLSDRVRNLVEEGMLERVGE